MWDRFRSTPAAAAPAHDPSSSTPASTRQLQLQLQQQQEQQQQGQRLPPSSTNIHNNTTTTSSLLTNPLSNNKSNTNTNNSNSWQPRSSVIAQRQRQQQPHHRQHHQQHQQQLRSASTDNYYPGSGSAGGYGGYQYSIKGGPPPPRPLRDLCQSRQQPRQQLHPPSAHAHVRHESKDSISGRPTSSVYSQPSPLHTTFAPQNQNQRDPPNVVRHHQPDAFDDDVSPPSSPELLSPGNVPNLDISPIDEEDDLAYRQPMPKMSAVSGLPSQQRAASRQGETPSPNAKSNIPMMRREKRQQRDAAAGKDCDNHRRQKPGSSNGRPRGEKNPRWDPMTGEISMNNEKSRPSQVKPLEFARGFGLGISSTASADRGATSPNPPKSASGMGDRVRQMGSRMGVGSGPKHQPQPQPESNTDPAAAAFTSNRPGWRGASGRTAIVEPVKDNPEVAPLKIPVRSDKRSSPRPFGGPSPSGGGAGKGPLLSPTSLGGAMANTIRRIIPSSQPDTYLSQSPSPSSPSPPPPLSQEPQSLSSSAEPSPTASQAPIRRKQVGSGGPPSAHLHPGRGAHHQPKESWASSVYSQQNEDASHAQQQQRPSDEIAPRPTPTIDTRNLPGAGNADSPYEQPPSRFSVTTYATSAHTSTPRESLEQFDRNYYNDADAPPLPTPPKDYAMTSYLDHESARTRQQQQPKGASVMDRSRPKTRNGTGNWDDENDAPEGRGLLGLRVESTNTSRPASILSVDKALPAAPPELSAENTKDRVAMLNAQLQSLGNRRININKSIKQMTELMPQDNLLATPEVMRKREMEKRKVDDLQQELADVQREEHELGMKLHRAYKRLDRQADYEPTTLWVRRATG
ncbi:hypothetical protein F5883DRAFT_412216 [Diaporthe sp. PMI_573]|nr:hypothetical protein F5883DRAFT_412216 [Diaporthaceae sp. PMI_573]